MCRVGPLAVFKNQPAGLEQHGLADRRAVADPSKGTDLKQARQHHCARAAQLCAQIADPVNSDPRHQHPTDRRPQSAAVAERFALFGVADVRALRLYGASRRPAFADEAVRGLI